MILIADLPGRSSRGRAGTLSCASGKRLLHSTTEELRIMFRWQSAYEAAIIPLFVESLHIFDYVIISTSYSVLFTTIISK